MYIRKTDINFIMFIYIFIIVTMDEVITVFEIPILGSRKVNRPDRETRFQRSKYY